MAAASPELRGPMEVGNFRAFKGEPTLSTTKNAKYIVYKGQHAETNEKKAMKEVNLDPNGGTAEERGAALRQERNHRYLIDQKIAHPNLVSIEAVVKRQHMLYIVMEPCTFGNISDHFKNNRDLSTNKPVSLRKKIRQMKDIACGLAYQHRVGIVHRNLEATNILVSATGAKIGGFGKMQSVGTIEDGSAFSFFQAPEMFADVPVCKPPSDLFPLGLICTAMVQAQPGKSLVPFAEGLTHFSTIGLELKNDPNLTILPNNTDDNPMLAELKQLIRQMLQMDPEERPTAAEVEQRLERLIQDYASSEDDE